MRRICLARRTFLPIHICPSDIGPQRSEWDDVYARVRTNYVVNAGNTVYGQYWIGNPKVPFGGAPFQPEQNSKLSAITDGLANTLMMSEVKVVPEAAFQIHGYWVALSDTNTSNRRSDFYGLESAQFVRPRWTDDAMANNLDAPHVV